MLGKRNERMLENIGSSEKSVELKKDVSILYVLKEK